VDATYRYSTQVLELASRSARGSFANRLAEPAVRFLDDVVGQRAGDGERFVRFFDALDRQSLSPEVDDALLGMRARQARLDEQDAKGYYDAQGCVHEWRVGPVEGHRGSLQLQDTEPGAELPDGRDPAIALTCAVRLWNSSPHPGVRRLRTQIDSSTDTLLLSLSGEEHFRAYVDGEEVYRSDRFDRWPARRARIAVPVNPGQHEIEIHTVVSDERAWQLLRVRDSMGLPIDARPGVAASGAVAGLRAPVRNYGRQWDGDRGYEPLGVDYVDPGVPVTLDGALYAPLRQMLRLDDALADGDTYVAEQAASRLAELAPNWPEGNLLRADFENIEPSRGKTNSAAREQAALEAALGADPSLDRARLRLLAMALERGELTEVVQQFEAFDAEERPTLGGIEGQLLRFETYRARGNELLADAALARAAALAPDNCDVLASQRAVAVERNWEKEVDRLVEALERCPGGSGLQARLAQRRGHFERAAAGYETRLERAADDLSAESALADIHVARDELDAAIERLTRIVERAPWRGTTRVKLADLLAKRGRLPEARAQLELALERSPHVTRLWEVAEHLGIRDELLGWRLDGKDAIAAYRKTDPSTYEGSAEVLVLDRDVVMVYPNGSQRHLIHQVTELRTKASIDQHGEIPSPDGARVLTLRTIKPDGRVVEPELIPGKEGLSLRELEVGDMFEIEYIVGSGPETSFPDYVDLSRFRFQSLTTPYHHSELVVVHPPEMPVQVEARNYPPKAVKSSKEGKTVLTFLAKEMERMTPEPAMRSALEELPMVRVFTKPDLQDWAGSLELQVRTAQRSNPELHELARSLTAGLTSDQDKLDVLRRWVLEEVEETAPIAHPATATLADREGNALMLLRVLLREAGVSSEVWLVRDRYGAQDRPDGHPLLEAYDSPMLAVYPDGAETPIMVMMSAKTIPLGYMTPGYQSAPAYRLHLLEGEAPSGVVQTPAVPAEHADARRYELGVQIGPEGDGTIEGFVELRGLEAILWRNELERLDRSRLEEAFQGAELQRIFPYTALDLDSLQVEGEDELEAPLRFRFSASGRGLAIGQGGRYVLPASPLPLNLANSFTSLPDRWSGLVVPYAPLHTVRMTVSLDGMQAVPSAAKDLSAAETSRFGDYKRTVSIDPNGRNLVLDIQSALNTGVVEADAYPELADFAQRVAGREELVLKLQ
jgi:tetratricopeptide (TPR) repeat protein